jgi:hypothetical protein
MNSTSWLKTDEVQFLFAFLLRNQDKTSGVFHVLGPWITHRVALGHEVMPAILHDKATDTEHRQYLSNLEDIQKYIDTRLDIFEHKFLVFACNINEMHWVSVVVVNPFLVFDPVLDDKDFAGWCVLNSTERSQEKQQHGFQGILHTRNNDAYGVHLFLNICASYLKAKKENKGEGRQQNKFHYEEPFGAFTEKLGTEGFPQFDYDCPAILQQLITYDCGLAVIAN